MRSVSIQHEECRQLFAWLLLSWGLRTGLEWVKQHKSCGSYWNSSVWLSKYSYSCFSPLFNFQTSEKKLCLTVYTSFSAFMEGQKLVSYFSAIIFLLVILSFYFSWWKLELFIHPEVSIMVAFSLQINFQWIEIFIILSILSRTWYTLCLLVLCASLKVT